MGSAIKDPSFQYDFPSFPQHNPLPPPGPGFKPYIVYLSKKPAHGAIRTCLLRPNERDMMAHAHSSTEGSCIHVKEGALLSFVVRFLMCERVNGLQERGA